MLRFINFTIILLLSEKTHLKMTEIVWDTRSQYVYSQTKKEDFKLILKRYMDFIANLNDENIEPVKVYHELSVKQKTELELIREVSKELQNKKIEYVNKQNAVEADTEVEQTEVNESEEDKETPVEEAQTEKNN